MLQEIKYVLESGWAGLLVLTEEYAARNWLASTPGQAVRPVDIPKTVLLFVLIGGLRCTIYMIG